MTVWARINSALTNITAVAEQVSAALRRASDRVLVEIARAVDIVYRFIRKMLVNAAKIFRELAKLAVVVLFFLYLLTLGLEVKPQSGLLGWLFLLLGVVGLLGIAFSFLASFHRADTSAVVGNDVSNGERTPALQRYSTFLLLDLLAIAVVAAWGLQYDYRFHTFLLRQSQSVGEAFVFHVWWPVLRYLGFGPFRMPQL